MAKKPTTQVNIAETQHSGLITSKQIEQKDWATITKQAKDALAKAA